MIIDVYSLTSRYIFFQLNLGSFSSIFKIFSKKKEEVGEK